jgi:hypothetical protein
VDSSADLVYQSRASFPIAAKRQRELTQMQEDDRGLGAFVGAWRLCSVGMTWSDNGERTEVELPPIFLDTDLSDRRQLW